MGRAAERNRDVGVVPIEVLRPGSREVAVNEKRVQRSRFPGSWIGSTVGSESEVFVDELIIYSLAVQFLPRERKKARCSRKKFKKGRKQQCRNLRT